MHRHALPKIKFTHKSVVQAVRGKRRKTKMTPTNKMNKPNYTPNFFLFTSGGRKISPAALVSLVAPAAAHPPNSASLRYQSSWRMHDARRAYGQGDQNNHLFYQSQLVPFPSPAGPAHQDCNDACKAQRIYPLAGRALFRSHNGVGPRQRRCVPTVIQVSRLILFLLAILEHCSVIARHTTS